MVKLIENVGEILVDKVSLTDGRIGIFIPLLEETENVIRLRKQFEKVLLHEIQLLQRERYFGVGAINTTSCLYINIEQDEKSRKYEIEYSIVFLGRVKDEQGQEVYCNITDHSPVELSTEDKAYINHLIMGKLQEIIFGEGKQHD